MNQLHVKLEMMDQPADGKVQSVVQAMEVGRLVPNGQSLETYMPSEATAGGTQALSEPYLTISIIDGVDLMGRSSFFIQV